MGSLTPLPRGKVMPKLERMGIPMTILQELSSTQLTEILCLVCMYDTKVHDKGIPDYVHEPYRNRSLTSDMAMEKTRLTSPAAYFCILRNPEFFSVDRLGIHHTFYEIPMQKATGKNPVDILSRARRSYRGYSFTITDLRDKIQSSGPRDMASSSKQQKKKEKKKQLPSIPGPVQ